MQQQKSLADLKKKNAQLRKKDRRKKRAFRQKTQPIMDVATSFANHQVVQTQVKQNNVPLLYTSLLFPSHCPVSSLSLPPCYLPPPRRHFYFCGSLFSKKEDYPSSFPPVVSTALLCHTLLELTVSANRVKPLHFSSKFANTEIYA